eukprot:8495043-Prorocentrum_lima.AAC.1
MTITSSRVALAHAERAIRNQAPEQVALPSSGAPPSSGGASEETSSESAQLAASSGKPQQTPEPLLVPLIQQW